MLRATTTQIARLLLVSRRTTLRRAVAGDYGQSVGHRYRAQLYAVAAVERAEARIFTEQQLRAVGVLAAQCEADAA